MFVLYLVCFVLYFFDCNIIVSVCCKITNTGIGDDLYVNKNEIFLREDNFYNIKYALNIILQELIY